MRQRRKWPHCLLLIPLRLPPPAAARSPREQVNIVLVTKNGSRWPNAKGERVCDFPPCARAPPAPPRPPRVFLAPHRSGLIAVIPSPAVDLVVDVLPPSQTKPSARCRSRSALRSRRNQSLTATSAHFIGCLPLMCCTSCSCCCFAPLFFAASFFRAKDISAGLLR